MTGDIALIDWGSRVQQDTVIYSVYPGELWGCAYVFMVSWACDMGQYWLMNVSLLAVGTEHISVS